MVEPLNTKAWRVYHDWEEPPGQDFYIGPANNGSLDKAIAVRLSKENADAIVRAISPALPAVDGGEPPLSCPALDRFIAATNPSDEVRAEIETVRNINSQLRYGLWHEKARADAAESRAQSLEEEAKAAALHVEQLSELLKIIKEHWIDYDHIFSISVHEADTWLSGRQALSKGEQP